MKKGKLIVISGFSGVGKGTVVKYLREHYENYAFSVSVTTREPRNNEVDGVDYHYITNEEFEKMIADNQLLEHAGYVDHYYGTPRGFVEKNIDEGRDVILEIETKGALQIKEKKPEAEMVFILPPSAEDLKNRLVNRQTESSEVIAERLAKAAEETESVDKYEYYVLNDVVEDCARRINDIRENNNPELLDRDFVEKIKKEILVFAKGE